MGKKLIGIALALALLLCSTTALADLTTDNITLYANFYDVGRQKEYDTLFAGFTALHPNIKVETTLSDVDYQANLMTMIASNTMPDIVMGEYEGLYNYGKAGHLIPITNESFIANYDPSIIAQMTAPNGEIYGLPSNIAGMGLFWNQEMFEKAGIEKFPATVTELQQACDKLKAAGFVPFGLAGSEAWTLGQMFFVEIASVQPDVMAFSKIADQPDADILLNEMLYGLKALDIQFNNTTETAPGNNYAAFLTDFATGKVAMIQMGTWAYSTIMDMNPDFTVRYAAVPYTEDPKDVRLSANIGVSMAIGSQTKYPEECKALFAYLASLEGQTIFGQNFKEIPLLDGVPFDDTPLSLDIKAYMAQGQICPWSQVLMSEVGRSEGSSIMQEYYFKQISAEDAVRQVYANWFK